MKRFNIMTAKKYQKTDGSQGTKWIKLGSIVQKDDGKMFGDLDCIPLGSWFDGSIQLFEVEQSNNNQSNNYQQGNYQQQPHQQNQYNQPQQQNGYHQQYPQ